MNRRRITQLLAAGLLLVGLAAGVLAQPASAARYWSSGPVGYVTLPTGICKNYTSWNRLDVQVYPPEIYAPNLYAGGGNDVAYARYQLIVLNRYGQVVQRGGYSGYALSFDNQRASFTGAPATFVNIPEFSTVNVRVEWVGANYTSAAEYRLDRYVLYSNNSGPYAAPSSCSKWKPPY